MNIFDQIFGFEAELFYSGTADNGQQPHARTLLYFCYSQVGINNILLSRLYNMKFSIMKINSASSADCCAVLGRGLLTSQVHLFPVVLSLLVQLKGTNFGYRYPL